MPVRIPAEVVAKVEAALNLALGIAIVHARDQHAQIMDAANALSDAINADGAEEG